MRKSYIATWALLACSVLLTLIFSITTFATRDNVMLEETVIYGDPSRADGLTLDFVTKHRVDKFWKTTYKLGNPDISQTIYHMYGYDSLPDEFKVERDEYFEGFTIGKSRSANEPLSDKFQNEADGWFEGKYYRLFAEFDFPCISPENHSTVFERPFDTPEEIKILGREKSNLQNYFRIPRIGIAGDSFSWKSVSTYSDDMCYFTFDLHTKKENIVDTSLLPDGFGIFAFPYEKGYFDEKWNHILVTDTSKLEMIFELDPNTHIRKLFLDYTQKHLLLFTAENGYIVLYVIDIETRTELQKLKLFENQDFATHIIDGALLVFDSDFDDVYVISKDKNQSYEIDFIFPWENDYFNPRNYTYFQCYDGERLVYSNFAGWFSELASYDSFDFFIAIYEKTGISYIGTYHSSLLSGIDNDNPGMYPCEFLDWPKASW